MIAGILHRIVENIGNSGAQIFGIAADFRTAAIQRGPIAKRTGLKMMAGAGTFHAVFNQLCEVHTDGLSFGARPSSLQDFLDGTHQPVRIFEHEMVEIPTLCVVQVHLLAFQRLQVQANGCDGRFQFVSDGVDEAIVLLVASDFADEKAGVEDEAGGNGYKEDDPEKNANFLTPVEDDPAKANRADDRGQHHAKRQKEYDFAATANAHAEILARGSMRQKRTWMPEFDNDI